MSAPEPYELLRSLIQENVEDVLGVDGVVVKAVLVAEIRNGEGEFISSIGFDVNGESLSLWDQLGLLHFRAHHLGRSIELE